VWLSLMLCYFTGVQSKKVQPTSKLSIPPHKHNISLILSAHWGLPNGPRSQDLPRKHCMHNHRRATCPAHLCKLLWRLKWDMHTKYQIPSTTLFWNTLKKEIQINPEHTDSLVSTKNNILTRNHYTAQLLSKTLLQWPDRNSSAILESGVAAIS
jgi:hypothetical protein